MRIPPIPILVTFPHPNYIDPVTRGPALVYVNGAFIGIAIVTVTLRVWTRIVTTKLIGWDDVWCVFGLIFAIGLTVAVMLANEKYHWNRHVWDIPWSEVPELGKIAIAAKLLYTLASTFVRLSLMCFYYRLVRDTGMNRFRIVVHCAMAFNIAVCISFIFLTIFLCQPISAYWTFPTIGHCLNEGTVTVAAGVITCFADLLTTVLPIPMILKLQMRRRQKIGVLFLLSLGFIVTIAGAIRTYYIWMSLVATYDETWYAYPLWIASTVEIDLAVITCCAPALRPFFSIYMRPLLRPISMLSRHFATTQASSARYGTPGKSAGSYGLDGRSKDRTLCGTEFELEGKFYDHVVPDTDSQVGLMESKRPATAIIRETPLQTSSQPASVAMSPPRTARSSSHQHNPSLRIYREQSFEMYTTAVTPPPHSPLSGSPPTATSVFAHTVTPVAPINNPYQIPQRKPSRDRRGPSVSSSRRSSRHRITESLSDRYDGSYSNNHHNSTHLDLWPLPAEPLQLASTAPTVEQGSRSDSRSSGLATQWVGSSSSGASFCGPNNG